MALAKCSTKGCGLSEGHAVKHQPASATQVKRKVGSVSKVKKARK